MYNGRYTRESLKRGGTILSEMVIEGEAVSGNFGSAHMYQGMVYPNVQTRDEKQISARSEN